jgi:uncharacterized membrane protein (Fun14 family)
MITWFTIAIMKRQYPMALFGTLHGCVGVGLLYGVLAGYLNKTYIRISYNTIAITHEPLPWFGAKSIVRSDVKQLYSKERVSHSDHGHTHTYSVHVMTRSEKSVELVSGLFSSEEALFVENEIEKYLKIADEPVRGELPR